MEICNFCRFIEDIEILFLHKCLLSSPPRFRQLLSKSLYSFGCYSNVKGKFKKKSSKIFCSEAVKRTKLKLCIHAYDISLYKVCVFIVLVPLLWLLWQLKVSIDEKTEIAIFLKTTAACDLKSGRCKQLME